MNPTVVLDALADIWDEVPHLLGAQWAQLFPRVEALLTEIAASDDAGRRASRVADLVLLLRATPARQRLWEAMGDIEDAGRAAERYRGADEPPTPGRAWDAVLNDLRARLSPPRVTRYTDITAPRRLAVGRRGVITVGLTRAPDPDSEAARPLEVQLKQFLDVYLQAQQEEFEIIGEPVRRLPVQSEDSPPAVFYVKALSSGTRYLSLDFYQSGIVLATVRLAVEVSDVSAGKETLPEEQLQALAQPVLAGGSYAPPVDLSLRVLSEQTASGTRLVYILHSPNGAAHFHWFPAGFCEIKGSPEAFQRRTLQKIEKLAAGKDMDDHSLTPEEVERKLAALGNNLYDELFSSELRAAYRKLHSRIVAGEIRTLLITSDEPWIPWELIRPYDAEDPDNIIDDDFLCRQLQLTRWLAGDNGAAGKIAVRRMACVEAGQPPDAQPLAFAKSERAYLSNVAAAQPAIEDVSPTVADKTAVDGLLDGGGIHLWHFAAHGNVSFTHADESVITLADGRGLRAEDIFGTRKTHIARDRPLVFLNACRVGQQSWSLTRLGGWAAVWVDRARCGAFIGPLWAVNDWLAYEFAHTFYGALQEGQTIGAATHAARERIRQMAPHNPTWLAYSVYGHPNGRVQFAEV